MLQTVSTTIILDKYLGGRKNAMCHVSKSLTIIKWPINDNNCTRWHVRSVYLHILGCGSCV